MGTPHHTALISLNLIFHPVLSTLRIQGSCLSPELERSQQAAGPFPIMPPSSRIASLLTSDSLTLLEPSNKNLKLLKLFHLNFQLVDCYLITPGLLHVTIFFLVGRAQSQGIC